jgi:hypothetical protein
VGNKDPKPPKKTIFRYLDKNPVRIATSNLFIDTSSVPIDYMVGVIFEEIGGQELIGYSMEDFSGDENISPIKDITKINERYSPYNIFPMARTTQLPSTAGSPELTLDLRDYLLEVSDETLFVNKEAFSLGDRSISLANPNVYIDPEWQNILIDLQDSAEGLILELDLVRFGDTF